MDLVIINATLYLGAFLIYWFKRRKIDIAFVLLVIYLTVSILGIFLYMTFQNAWKLQLWSFIYLFVVNMLFLRPILVGSINFGENVYVKNNTIPKLFVIFYSIVSIVVVYYDITIAMNNISTGAWKAVRNQLYEGDLVFYTSSVERYAKIFSSYLRPLAVVLLFYYMTKKNIKSKWLVVLSMAVILPSFLSSINTASRGSVLKLVFSLIFAYLIFQNRISQKRKKTIIVGFASLLTFFFFYVIAITVDRFGERGQSHSLLSYFGQSMLTFNYGLTDSIHDYGNGKFFFDWFINVFGLQPINVSLLGTHFGSNFFTLVGAWYLDFGPIGTFLIAIFFPMFIGSFWRNKNHFDIADIYILTFYINYLAMGVFVIGRGDSLQWLMAFTIFGIFKFFK